MHELHERPAPYDTLPTHCTASILFRHTRMNPESPSMWWKVLLRGYVPDYLDGLDRIDTSRPFVELEKLSHFNERSQAADRGPAVSRRIKKRLPQPRPLQ